MLNNLEQGRADASENEQIQRQEEMEQLWRKQQDAAERVQQISAERRHSSGRVTEHTETGKWSR